MQIDINNDAKKNNIPKGKAEPIKNTPSKKNIWPLSCAFIFLRYSLNIIAITFSYFKSYKMEYLLSNPLGLLFMFKFKYY